MCDIFQQMEINRISCLRNCIWVFSNVLSDMCCQLDDSRENIRGAAESCNAEEDVKNFSLKKSYCTTPLRPIEYVPPARFANDADAAAAATYAVVAETPNGVHIQPKRDSEDEWDDEIDFSGTYTAQYDYDPRTEEEMSLRAGEMIKVLSAVDRDWVQVVSLTSRSKGLVPLNYLHAAGTT